MKLIHRIYRQDDPVNPDEKIVLECVDGHQRVEFYDLSIAEARQLAAELNAAADAAEGKES